MTMPFLVDPDDLEALTARISGLAGFVRNELDELDRRAASLTQGGWTGPGADADRQEELAKDPAHGGNADDRSRREAAAALEAEAAKIIPGSIIRAPFNEDGQDQGDVVDADGQHWDVKSSPYFQPSYRPEAGKALPRPQTDASFIDMVEDQTRDGVGVLVDSDGMSTERRLHIAGIIENFPEWTGKVWWTS